jgi:hypothetical protein
MGDVNGDGYLDIYVSNFSGEKNNLWINDGFGNFSANDISGDSSRSSSATMGDVDGDGDLDIYVTNILDEQNNLWINDGSGNFTSNNITGDNGNSSGATMGDVDGDGDLDIYVANVNNQQNKLWINDGSGNFSANDVIGDNGDSDAVVMGDVDNDGDLDIYVANREEQQNKLWINVSNTTAPVSTASAAIDKDTGGTLSLEETDTRIDLNVPTNVSPQSSLVFQVKKQPELTVVSSLGLPSGKRVVRNQTYQLNAYSDISTILEDFDNPISITLRYSDEDVSGIDESSLAIYRHTNGTWQELDNCEVNIRNNRVSCDTPGFSIFGLFGEESTTDSRSSQSRQVQFTCTDPEAINYSRFGRHDASSCEYEIVTLAMSNNEPAQQEVMEVEQQSTISTCSLENTVTDNMKVGDRDGQYSSYNNGIVTQVSLLQQHINRILADTYDQAAGPVDGVFGPLTKQGVERLQTALNLKHPNVDTLVIDGIVGPATKNILNESC